MPSISFLVLTICICELYAISGKTLHFGSWLNNEGGISLTFDIMAEYGRPDSSETLQFDSSCLSSFLAATSFHTLLLGARIRFRSSPCHRSYSDAERVAENSQLARSDGQTGSSKTAGGGSCGWLDALRQ